MIDRDPGRAAYVAFVREIHPDRGGDVDTFIAGLANLRAGTGRPGPAADRYDAPIVLVVRKRVLRAIPGHIQRWRKRRWHAPRVR